MINVKNFNTVINELQDQATKLYYKEIKGSETPTRVAELYQSFFLSLEYTKYSINYINRDNITAATELKKALECIKQINAAGYMLEFRGYISELSEMLEELRSEIITDFKKEFNKFNNKQLQESIKGIYEAIKNNRKGYNDYKRSFKQVEKFLNNGIFEYSEDNEINAMSWEWLEILTTKYKKVKWLQSDDDIKKYIYHLSNLLNNFNYSKSEDHELYTLITEITEANSKTTKEMQKIAHNFQLSLLNTEVWKEIKNNYYTDDYFIMLNNDALEESRGMK